MNKKMMVIAGIILAVVLVTVGVLVFNTSDEDENASVTNSTSTDTSDTTAQSSSIQESTLANLLANDKTITCTFSYSNEESNFNGTGYFANGENMRVNYSGQVNGKDTNFSTIVTGGTSYFWNNETNKGFKSSVDPATLQPTNDSSSDNQGIDPDKNIKFDCSDWQVDTAMFSPPSNVDFTDLSNIQIPTIPNQ
ncbi:hypothetical protein KC946_01925 [Candidatus Saccharibacteria bacterium]|nr:hypothetical protein [Candidatus Saccharibacteria bacterium]